MVRALEVLTGFLRAQFNSMPNLNDMSKRAVTESQKEAIKAHDQTFSPTRTFLTFTPPYHNFINLHAI